MMVAATSEDASMESRLLVSVSPRPGVGWFTTGRSRGALVLVRPLYAPSQAAIVGITRALFGLTAPEARLAATLATGLPLRESGAALGVTYNTARTYLDRIYRKTATSHQGRLVALLKSIGTPN
jgi:DNA-binding CsgD family transcriptional regulator